jgi:succinoglycan biosynthesis transport protein ExoP
MRIDNFSHSSRRGLGNAGGAAVNAFTPSAGEFLNGTTPGTSDGLDVRQILLTVWRHKWLVLSVTTAITVLSYLYIGSLTPRYTAEATLLLDTRSANVGIDPVVSDLRPDANVIRSEVDVLRSRWLAHRVVQDLDLANDPEFNPALRPPEPSLVERLGVIDWLPQSLRGRLAGYRVDTQVTVKLSDASPASLSTVINVVLSKLTVLNDGRSYTVTLYCESEDPQKAARIVNSFAELYLASQRESKYQAAERGATWLEQKIGELRERVRRTENAALEYRNQHSLLDLGGGTLLDNRLTDLTNELAEAKNQRIRAETRLSEIRRLVAAAERGSFTPGTTSAPELERLLGAARQVRAQLAELGTTYGEKHPRMIEAKAQVDALETQVEHEVNRIVTGLHSEASLAAAQEKEFAAELEQLELQNLRAHRDALELHSLTSEAAASRSLLDTFLANLDRTAVQLDLVQPDARILSRAEAPTWPSYPQRRILLALTVVGSLMVSLAIVFVLESLHKGFRAAQQIEAAFGVPVIGMVPLVKSSGVGDRHPSSYALEHPFSTFTEAVRLIRSATGLSEIDDLPKVVLVTSAVPDEGKTALALTLGRVGAASGERVLLIDCDLRLPSVATDLGTTCGNGLTELLTGEATISEVVRIDAVSGLRFIPAGCGSFDAIELLSSGRMHSIIAAACQVSDTVILDSPPVMLVSDPLALSRVADMTLMVVRWDRTPRSLVAEAMKKLAATKALPTGIVLSRVNLARHASYGFGDFPYRYLKGYLSS